MAWTSVNAPIGNACNDKTAGTTIVGTVQAGRDIAIGDVVLVAVAKDETGTGTTDGDQNEVTGVADSGGVNVYQKIAEYSNTQTAAAADGCVIALFMCHATAALAAGGTITATFSASTTASCMSTRKFTIAAGARPHVAAVVTLANDAADPGSMDTTVDNLEHLWVRLIAFETANTGLMTNTAAYAGNFDATQTAGGLDDTNMKIQGEIDIFTGTSNPSDPTWAAGPFDNASILAVFREVPPGKGLLLAGARNHILRAA